jgi:hypothetical protein
MRDIRRDTVEIRGIHAGLTRWWRILDMALGRVGGMLVGEVKAVEAMAFAARSTGVVMEATGAVVVVTES